MRHYTKAIVAVVWAIVAIVQVFWPGTPVDGITQDMIGKWVLAATNVAGAWFVYQLPNKPRYG